MGNHFVRVAHRITVRGDAVGKSGGIKHRRKVIDPVSQIHQPLPDLAVAMLPLDITENVGGGKNRVGSQPFLGFAEKTVNCGNAALIT